MNHLSFKKCKAGMLTCFILIFIVLVTAGCKEEENESPAVPAPVQTPLRLEYWTPFSGGDNLFMTELVDQFNREHPAIQVAQKNSRLDDYYSRLKTAVLSGNAPDVAIIHASSLPQFVQNGYIEDVSLSAKKAGIEWNNYNSANMKAATFIGKPYAVPLDTHALVMYYNKPMLRTAGVLNADGKPVLAKGTKGFTAFLKTLQASLPDGITPLAQPSTRIDSVWLWWSLYNQMEGGGTFYNKEGTKAVFDNKQALESLKYVDGLYKARLIGPDINDAFKMFYEGKAAVFITGMWATGALEKASGLDFGVVPLPTLYDKPAAWADSHTLAIPTQHEMSEEKREASMVFIKWLTEHGAKWAEAGHVPSMKQVIHSPEFQALPYRSDYAASANSVAYWPRHTRQWTLVEMIIRQFERMIYGQQTPEETLKAAVKQINLELSK
ncbi:ABC transporter substrate-binding protein [Paenibacillus gansuensis]|uniref:ABC transporter substrate-binding protein n=1 Tax=Paenibacillus gansuensis TaxID=306542 RepID=A0ABW5PB97_9BACL